MTSLRFAEEGPHVPRSLMEAQARGELVFVCGAEVSMTAGLPSFRRLVEGIYRRIRES